LALLTTYVVHSHCGKSIVEPNTTLAEIVSLHQTHWRGDSDLRRRGAAPQDDVDGDRVWRGAFNMTHVDEILPADSAPCEQVFGADPLWSESSLQTKCRPDVGASKKWSKQCDLEFANVTAKLAQSWNTHNCATCKKLLWKLPYPTNEKAPPQEEASWLKVGERYLEPRNSCTSCKDGSVMIMYSVHDRVGTCFKFSPAKKSSTRKAIISTSPIVRSARLKETITGNNHRPKALVMSNEKLMTRAFVGEQQIPIWSLGEDKAAQNASEWFKKAGVVGKHGISKATCYARKQVQCSGDLCEVRKVVQCANICQAWIPKPKCRPDLCRGQFGHVACLEMTTLL